MARRRGFSACKEVGLLEERVRRVLDFMIIMIGTQRSGHWKPKRVSSSLILCRSVSECILYVQGGDLLDQIMHFHLTSIIILPVGITLQRALRGVMFR